MHERHIGDVEVGEGATPPHRVLGENVAGVPLRSVTVATQGEGAQYVQLALNADGEPGEWQDSSIEIAERLDPEEGFTFWFRVDPPDDDKDLGEKTPSFAVTSKRFI
jgi:hypothetical protein